MSQLEENVQTHTARCLVNEMTGRRGFCNTIKLISSVRNKMIRNLAAETVEARTNG
jgi:hypothetical protein